MPQAVEGRALGATLILCVGGAVGPGCTCFNAIDACSRAAPHEAVLNLAFPGAQFVTSPRAAAALPQGGAVVVFESVADDEWADLRLERVTDNGVPKGACPGIHPVDEAVGRLDRSTGGSRAAVAGPEGTGTVGLIVFEQHTEGDDGTLWGQFIDADGCRTPPDAFLIGNATVADDVGAPQVLNLRTQTHEDFAVFWYRRVNLDDPPLLLARVIQYNSVRANFLPTVDSARGEAVPLSVGNGSGRLAAVSAGPGHAALFWSELGARASAMDGGTLGDERRLWMASMDDRLRPLMAPRVVGRGWAKGAHDVVAAFDGATYLVASLAVDDDGLTRLFGQVVSPRGAPVSRAGAPNGAAFRLGAARGVVDSLPTVTQLMNGGFFIAWRQAVPGSDSGDLRGHVLAGDGRARFNSRSCDVVDFGLNQATAGDQRQPSLALLLPSGVLLATWTDLGGDGLDTSGGSVRGVALRPEDLLVDPGRPVWAVLPDEVDLANDCVADPGTVTAGLQCACASDCRPGVECIPEERHGVPGGRCLSSCDGDSGAKCGAFETCVDGRCETLCSAASSCPRGRMCRERTCVPFCAEDGDCESGRCEPYTGLCLRAGPGDGGIDAACVLDGDCRSNRCEPVTRTCLTYCLPSRPHCPEGGHCHDLEEGLDVGLCHRTSAVESSGPFLACNATFECPPGALCYPESATGYPGGACVLGCLPPWGVDCGDGGVCLRGACHRTCAGPGDCPPGRVCSTGACMPFCADDADCISGHCDRYLGACVDGGAPPPGMVGVDATCQKDSDCRSDLCASASSRCLSYCQLSRPSCPEDAGCVAVATNDDLGECHLDRVFSSMPCQHDSQCEMGATCAVESVRGWPHGGCASMCSNDDWCAPTERCSAKHWCEKKCVRSDDCGTTGRLCHERSCMPFCVYDDDCESRHCDSYTGECRDGGVARGWLLGEPCALAADCRSWDCRGEPKTCHTLCQVSRPNCPEDAGCVVLEEGDDLGECIK